jgi:hypothetical protein
LRSWYYSQAKAMGFWKQLPLWFKAVPEVNFQPSPLVNSPSRR